MWIAPWFQIADSAATFRAETLYGNEKAGTALGRQLMRPMIQAPVAPRLRRHVEDHRYPDHERCLSNPEPIVSITRAEVTQPVASSADLQYRQFMIRELLIWLVGIPVPIAAAIGMFVL